MGCCSISKSPCITATNAEFHAVRGAMVSAVVTSAMIAGLGIFGILAASGVLPQSISFAFVNSTKALGWSGAGFALGAVLTIGTIYITYKFWPDHGPGDGFQAMYEPRIGEFHPESRQMFQQMFQQWK